MAKSLSPNNFAGNAHLRRERVGDNVSIYQIADSSNWYISYSVDGKQVRQTLKTKSAKRAKALAKKRDAELTLGINPAREKPVLIGEAIDKYLRTLRLRKIASGTLSDYERSLRHLETYAKSRGISRLDRVNEELLEDFQQRLEEEGMKGLVQQKKRGRRLITNAQRTVRNKLKTARQLIRWSIKRRLLREDPAGAYILPPTPKGLAYCWNVDEHKSICEVAEQPWRDIFDFLALTGLRSDELCWLLKSDVVLGDKSYIHVRCKKCQQTGKSWQPKHGRERIVPLCKEAVVIAKRALAFSRGEWLFWSLNATGKQKGHFRPDSVWRALQRTKKKAGVQRGTVHTFRHLFCSFMANNKVSPFKVMKIMGHGSLEIVLLYYHVSDGELLTALDAVEFDKLIGTLNQPEEN